jgi:hypothetical protein
MEGITSRIAGRKIRLIQTPRSVKFIDSLVLRRPESHTFADAVNLVRLVLVVQEGGEFSLGGVEISVVSQRKIKPEYFRAC